MSNPYMTEFSPDNNSHVYQVKDKEAAPITLLNDTVGWTGKNQLINHFKSGTYNGLTVVVNDDKSISISGTASANTYMSLHSRNADPVELEQGDYILSGCPEGGSENTYQLFYIEYDSNGQEVLPYRNDYGTGVSFQRTSNNQYNITILVKSGQNMTGKTFYPMIRRASIADDTFEPYHASVDVAKANRDEVKDVIGWSGKNKFNPPKSQTVGTTTQSTFTADSEGYISSTAIDNRAWGYNTANVRMSLKAGKYKVKAFQKTADTSGSDSFRIFNSSNTNIFQHSISDLVASEYDLSLPSDANIGIQYKFNDGVYAFMIWDASIVDPTYEPYHASVEQTLRDAEVIEGKNILEITANTQTINGVTFTVNSDGSVKVNGTASAMALFVLNNNLDKVVNGGHYVLSGCPSGGGENSYRLEIRNSSDTIYTNAIDTGSGSGDIAPTSGFPAKATIRIASGYTANNVVFKPMLCTKDEWDKSHDFEPYYIPLKDSKFDRSEQRVLGAWNILPYPYWHGNSRTHNGITFTVNEDGSVTCSGTATGEAAYTFFNQNYKGDFLNALRGQTLKILGGISNNVRIQLWKTGGVVTSSHGNEASFTVDSSLLNANEYNLSIIVNNGTNISTPITIYPMLLVESNIDKTYASPAMTNREITKILAIRESAVTNIISGASVYDNTNYLVRSGNVVQLMLQLDSITTAAAWSVIICKIPSGFRPKRYVRDRDTKSNVLYNIAPNGEIVVDTALSNQSIRISATWITADNIPAS